MKDTTIKGYIIRIFWVVIGQAISAYGIGMTIFADLGLFPWDVFNQGVCIQLQKHFGIEVMMGTVAQMTSIVIVVIVLLLKETIGISTILDALIYGAFLNFFMKNNLLPSTEIYAMRFVLLESVLWYGQLVYTCICSHSLVQVHVTALWLHLPKETYLSAGHATPPNFLPSVWAGFAVARWVSVHLSRYSLSAMCCSLCSVL